MKVKRYVVQDVPEAVQMIRSELGSDAVILNTKEIRMGGFLGMFRKKRVEVIAAVDESAGRPAPRAPRPAPPRERAAVLTAEAEPAPAQTWIPHAAVREKYGRGGAGEAIPPSPKAAEAAREILASLSAQAAGATAAPIEKEDAESSVAEPKKVETSREVELSEKAVSASSPAAANAGQSEDETAALLNEIRSMKEMMLRMNRQMSFRHIPPAVMNAARRLAEQGVEPVYVEQFAESVCDRLGDLTDPDGAETAVQAREVLREWLRPSAAEGISPATRIVNFVGPTGVGKTTTIAKLAADQAFVHRRSVGFITADTYRIAAVDQLRTYADILNVPLEVVFSPSELSRAYKKLEDRDLLLMDTAGRNYRNELFVSEVNSLLAPGERAESVLVLSLTHKYADMKTVAGQFAKYGVKRLLFTKMDETDSYGAIVNLVREFDYSISYVTTGQTVPDDIRAFDPEDLIDRLLGGKGHE
ncbi:flagellar biosynthesis protein FlhF [Cohnella zeiphila]|uniref:Flagellar biosynthesis protein FlhF n=1 Tax=Cohnella zeiphila TaxID=2761120 RepID=A0A7X0SMR8_9BACL|nr:flagellar biosynthesis protein FlhF [Cohnella zeiphila]MBB6732868.1 flagellar biosynthesis protein FlhF [Cohnella zeiphila]